MVLCVYFLRPAFVDTVARRLMSNGLILFLSLGVTSWVGTSYIQQRKGESAPRHGGGVARYGMKREGAYASS